jgi:transposase
MHANQKPRRRHSEEFKAQVMAACGEPGASVSAVALSFGLNTNLVRQWQHGRGYKPNQVAALQAASQAQPQFVALSLPAPGGAAAPSVDAAAQVIRVELKRGALAVNVSWPVAASSQCTAWLRELLQ